MDKYAKRLQSRLSAKGHRFNKEQCRQALSTTAANPELPTDAEMIAAFNWLTRHDSEEATKEIEAVTVDSETSAIEPSSDFINSFTGLAESSEDEAIAPIEKEEQIERQTNLPSSMQEPDLGPSPKATGIVPHQSIDSGEITQGHGGITQAQVTQAIAQAIAQTGQQGNVEAIQILTTLANELSSDIADTQDMVTALVTAYLGKRQHLLSAAIGTLTNLRTAQTESFQAGLDQDFFDTKDQSKREFLAKIGVMFS